MMDMARLRKLSQSAPFSTGKNVDGLNQNALHLGRKPSLKFFTLIFLLVGAFFILPSILSLSNQIGEGKSFGQNGQKAYIDLYLDGLLTDHPEEDQCQSRFEAQRCRQASKYKPSKYLISRLREYEARHRRCAGEAKNFNESWASQAASGQGTADCKFVVWIAYSGLGNRMVTLVAAFLYALLTDRVLLVDKGIDINDLFCEPFPGTSWLLPPNFSHQWLEGLNETSPYRFGHLIDRGGKCLVDVSDIRPPLISYIHVTHTFNDEDKRFFCAEEQRLLKDTPWLFVRSNSYYVPSLYFIPSFEVELEKLFPDRAVFHHVGRYLFHPSDAVWGLITRFYYTYLAGSENLVGLQIRTFDVKVEGSKHFLDQVVKCALEKGVLPEVEYNGSSDLTRYSIAAKKPTSVLVTSLFQDYYEALKDMYVRHPTVDGSIVRIFLPSHEGWQQTDKADHDRKALMEIFLLSFCDTLITSPMSTFGYAAQGLAGLKPFILTRNTDGNDPEPACSRDYSTESCFHAPPLYNCDCQGGRDPGKILKYVKHCQDVEWGTKLEENVSEG